MNSTKHSQGCRVGTDGSSHRCKMVCPCPCHESREEIQIRRDERRRQRDAVFAYTGEWGRDPRSLSREEMSENARRHNDAMMDLPLRSDPSCDHFVGCPHDL